MRIVRTTAVTTAVAVAALIGAGMTPAAAASPTGHQRPAVVMHVLGKRAVQAPQHTNPGLVQVRNTGKRPVVVLTPLKSAGVATLVKELKSSDNSAQPDFTRDFAVVDMLMPHTTVYLHLARGVLYLLDGDASKYTAADVTTVHVKGAKRNAVAPKATPINVRHNGTLTAVPKQQLDKNASVRVLNKGKHLEEVFVAAVNKDVTDSQLNKYLAHPSFQGLYKIASFNLKLIGLSSPHHGYSAQLHSKAGRHLLVALALTGTKSMLNMRPGQVRLLNLK